MSKTKVALIGAGVWGEVHAKLYREHPGVELVAVCDQNIERARKLADTMGLSAVFSDHREMLDAVDFDAVSIVTPDFAHGQATVDCANAGKDILVEKPLATTREDVEAIVEAVQRNGVRIMVDLHNRWSPPFAVAHDCLMRGELGDPVSAYFRLNDIRWVATDMLPWAAKSSILWFLGSHSVDTLRWFMQDEVESVYAVCSKGVLASMGVDAVDVYQTILKFRRGGIATMENSWITPNTHPCINDIKFNITGTRGMINLDLSNNQMIERFTEDRNDRPDVLVQHFVHGKAKGFAYESIRHFIDNLVTGEEFLVSLEDAVNTSLVILAILESAETGQPVKVRYLGE
ncbi:MAG: Gfo/Idh/MocA family oxidoreductase [Firmicutes bacterium]|jgi:predicted dehydrogenase|nr:Gfo/Idh/MocA family oxidoreductase [Bacillota bacterium]